MSGSTEKWKRSCVNLARKYVKPHRGEVQLHMGTRGHGQIILIIGKVSRFIMISSSPAQIDQALFRFERDLVKTIKEMRP